jgi:hypothetical protein
MGNLSKVQIPLMRLRMINYTINASNRESFFEQVKKLDPTVLWQAKIVERKSSRTLDQNARYWKLITDFGEYCGYDREEMHQEVGRRFLTYEKKMPNGEIKKFVKSTTKLTTKEMAELQEHIERVAAQQGFIFEDR